MKITCQACAAKYTIADEKVLGKIVKIRCKKCGATIVVNGNDPSASAGPSSQGPRAFDYAAQQGGGEPWTVNVADGDQRTMVDSEIAAAYQAGVVTEETFCWKDGMSDWLPLREIDDLRDACTATRAVAPHQEEGITRVQESPAAMFGNQSPAAPAYAAQAPAYAAPAPVYAAPAPAAGNGGPGMMAAPAARRAGGRAPAADLFSGAAQAGSEEDVMTSAPTGMPQAHEDQGALTGARNENSVLFSLNALTSNAPGGKRAPMPPSSEASGLIDIRQLGAQIGMGDDKKQRRLDDIMNLAGGGAFSPSLGAPVLAPPPIEEYAPRPEPGTTGAMPAQPKSRGLILLAIGGGVLVVAGAIGAAVMFMGKTDTSDTGKASASASAMSTSIPSASAGMNAALPTTTATATGSATAAAPSSSTAATPSASTTSKVATTATTKSTTTTATTAAATAATTAAPTATAAAAATAAAGGSDQPFNMGEAKARLAAIAGSVQGCKKGDISGSGRVVVTFAPSGGVSSAVVTGPPFEGTPTGACVASRFRGARVPAFAGSPFSVSKSFSIN